MARARETWADVGWHEEELEGQTWQQRSAQQSATSAIWLGVASFATSLVAAFAWPFTTWPAAVVLGLSTLSAVLGVAALVHLRRRRVRHLVAVVVAAVAAANGVMTLGLVAERVVLALGR